jgi:hypothetical protein
MASETNWESLTNAKKRQEFEEKMLQENQKGDAHFFSYGPDSEDLYYFLENNGAGFISGTPCDDDNVSIQTELIAHVAPQTQHVDKGKMRTALEKLRNTAKVLVYNNTPIGSTGISVLSFDTAEDKKQVYVKVVRHEQYRFDITIFTLAFHTVTNLEDDNEECNEDPMGMD